MAAVNVINSLSNTDFVSLLGGVYEHSEWVAQRVVTKRPFSSRDALREAMQLEVDSSDRQVKLTLLKAHPEFAGVAAQRGELTNESTREQGSLSLNKLPADQHRRMQDINACFMQKFGFPGIVAVRMQSSVENIFALLEQRLANNLEQEIAAAITQVHLIARCRLEDLIDE